MPRLPVVEADCRKLDFSVLDFKRITENCPSEFDIRYLLDGRRFSYYPASILTILNDLHLELGLFQKRKPHDITLSGYTILRVSFLGEFAVFTDPVEELHGDMGRAVCGNVIAIDVEESMRNAVQNVWSVSVWANDIKGPK